jgi:hypothetical protein
MQRHLKKSLRRGRIAAHIRPQNLKHNQRAELVTRRNQYWIPLHRPFLSMSTGARVMAMKAYFSPSATSRRLAFIGHLFPGADAPAAAGRHNQA